MKVVSLKNYSVKLILVSILVLLAVVVDVFINFPSDNVTTSDLLPEIPVRNAAQNPESAAQAVLSLYSQFDMPIAVEVEQPEAQQKTDTLTLEQQEQQKGLLRALYINNERYRLNAIINQQQFVASLSVTDANDIEAVSKRLQLRAGDKLYHYEVVSVTARRITLRHEERELWLQLFTPEKAQPEAE